MRGWCCRPRWGTSRRTDVCEPPSVPRRPPPSLGMRAAGLSAAVAGGPVVQRRQGPGVQPAQRRPDGGAYGTEVEARHDPLPSFGVVYPSLPGLEGPGSRHERPANAGARDRRRAGATPGRPVALHGDTAAHHDPRPPGVSLATVTVGSAWTRAPFRRFPQRGIKNGLTSAASYPPETIRAVPGMAGGRDHGCHSASNSVDLAYAGAREMNRSAAAPVLSVDGRLPAGRGAGPAAGARGVGESGDAPPRAVAPYANPRLTFPLDRAEGETGRAVAYAVARTGGRMRQRAGSAFPVPWLSAGAGR